MNDAKQWDELVAKKTGWCHTLQSAEWAATKDKSAWKADLTEVGGLPVTVYGRPAAGLGQLFYIPKLARLEAKTVGKFTKAARAMRGVAVKLEIDQPFSDKLHSALLDNGWQTTGAIQYAETVLVDLTKSPEDLLASFKKRARWELNAGARRGVKAQKAPLDEGNMKLAYEMLKTTSERSNFWVRNAQFTYDYWQAFAKNGHGSLYVAKLKGKPLAAAFVVHVGGRAFYKDGASLRHTPDVFASRVMQWQVMRDLKEQGVKTYDLCGVSTSAGTHLTGVSLFKTGFGDPQRLQGAYVLPLSAWRYQAWRLAEPWVLRIHSKRRGDLWY